MFGIKRFYPKSSLERYVESKSSPGGVPKFYGEFLGRHLAPHELITTDKAITQGELLCENVKRQSSLEGLSVMLLVVPTRKF